MSQGTVTISRAAREGKPFSASGKDFLSFGIQIGTDAWYDYVIFSDQDAPQKGDVIENMEIFPKEGKYNDHIRGKLVRKVGTPSTEQTAEPVVEQGYDDRQKSIVRQHSQEMALRYFALATNSGQATLKAVVRVTDFFEADAWGKATEWVEVEEGDPPHEVEPEPTTQKDDGIPF